MKRITVILLVLIIAILSFAGCSSIEKKTPERWCVEETIRQNELYYSNETVMAYYIEDVTLCDSELLELADEYESEFCICRVMLITTDNITGTTYEHNYIAFIAYEKDFFEKVVGAKWVEESWIIDCDAEEIKVGE